MNNDNQKRRKNINRINRSRTKGGKNKGNNQVVNSNGSTAAVQNRLRNNNRRTMVSKIPRQSILDVGYARCRLNPFNAGTSMGIPDSNAERKLVFDHRGTADFSVNGNASIIILPTLPFGACIKPDSSAASIIVVDGDTITQSTTNNQPWSWVPMAFYNDVISTNNTQINSTIIGTNAISNRSRIAGVGFRLLPTSPAVDISGIIEIVDSELAVEQAQFNNVSVIATNASEGTQTTWNQATMNIMQIDMTSAERYQTTVAKTVQMRPEMMPQGVLKHAGPYLWQTTDEQPTMAVSSIDTTKSFFTYGTGTKSTTFGNVYNWDSSFSVKRIRITTPKVVSFRLEVIACVEYIIANNTPYARLATAKPKVDTVSVGIVDTALASMPAAVSPSQNEGVVNKLLRAVSVAAPIAGSLFGPAGAAIGAGVAGITDAISNVL